MSSISYQKYNAVAKERDQQRAEVERLRALCSQSQVQEARILLACPECEKLKARVAELEAALNLQPGQRYAIPAEIDAALNADTTAVYTIPDAALNEPMSRKQFIDAVLHELTARGLLASREIVEQVVREAGIQPDRFGFFTQKQLDDFKAHFQTGA